MTFCVYGITTSRQVPAISGVHLVGVRAGRLTAIVSPVRRAPASTHSNLRRYHRVVAGIADQLPALLPTRFGTTMDEAELTFVLRARAGAFENTLRHLRGRVQMTLRTTAMAAPSRAASTGRQADSGTAYLRRVAAEKSADRLVPALSPVRSTLERWIRDERVDVQRGLASVYHLIPRRSAAAYARAAAMAAAEAHVRVVISGPFPPYAFGAL